jgi:cell filamentation protein
MTGRYAAHGMEAEFEPGSRRRVLRNLLGIRSARTMARAESEALIEVQEELVASYSAEHRFTAANVCAMHRAWLGRIYSWAGEVRNVNIAKGDFHFAAALRIPRLMQELEARVLAAHTPCRAAPIPELARSLAVVHAELVLIHPFREGNGRCARLLSLLMAFQAGLPPLDFEPLGGRALPLYIAAIHAALDSNYEPMAERFSEVIARTLRQQSGEPSS